jgi:hypothetical protein
MFLRSARGDTNRDIENNSFSINIPRAIFPHCIAGFLHEVLGYLVSGLHGLHIRFSFRKSLISFITVHCMHLKPHIEYIASIA